MRTSQNLIAWRRFSLSGVWLLLSLFVWAIPATAAPLDSGVAWLAATQRTDGAWGDVLPLQATAKVVSVLREIVPGHPAIAGGVAYLQTATVSNMDSLARIVATTASTPTDLLTLQNADGGWGLAAGFGSEPWTTALALRALVANGNGASANATQAVNWLLSNRLDDGGWAYTAGETSRVALTAEVVRALGSVPRNLDIQATLDRAVTLLQAKRGTDGGYGDVGSTPLETGLVVRALAAAGADLAPITPATLAYLTAGQQANGSWQGDPYVTAIALHAVWLLQNPPVRPTTGGVTAQVLDAATGQALAGVSARRYGEAASVLTDALGRFTLDGLPAGSVTLEFSRGGYLTQTGMATVTVGVDTPLGTVRLAPTPATVSVMSRTYYS